MLQVNNMNYNATAVSVGANDEILANFYFNADNYSNYSFSINYKSINAIADSDVAADFDAFKAQVAAAVENDIAPYATTPPAVDEP